MAPSPRQSRKGSRPPTADQSPTSSPVEPSVCQKGVSTLQFAVRNARSFGTDHRMGVSGTGYETPELYESFASPNPQVLSMARIARVVVPGCWHHITQRGNRRQSVFFDDADYSLSLQLLPHHTRRCAVRIVGYCLMGNHVHLIAIPPAETALAKSLGRAHVDYARWLN